MTVAGIDIGSRAAKVVILDKGMIVASVIRDTGPESVKTANMAISEALKGTGLSVKDLEYVVATGYGRVLVPFANENISEISCHGRGINFYFPSVRTVLDMGGQDCKAISVDGSGVVTNFVMNDKCAGGTGRFLEMIAEVLGLPLGQIGETSLASKNAIPFNTICAVFAKSEAIGYLRKGVDRSDILSGLHEAISMRCLNLLKRVSIQPDFAITGGIAKNKGMVAKIRDKVGLEPQLCPDPQLAGALGAAIFAEQRKTKQTDAKGKVQYGYSDGTGSYYITLDYAPCDSCGECVKACPEHVFTMQKNGSDGSIPVVSAGVSKKLALVCPGSKGCVLCQKACLRKAISHSW